MSRTKRAKLASVPALPEANADVPLADVPTDIGDVMPAADYRDIPPSLLLVIQKFAAERDGAAAAAQAAQRTFERCLIDVADAMGFRPSQVNFENLPGPDGTTVLKLRVL